VFTLLFEAQ